MEMLNSINMLLSSNVWATIINLFAKWIVNYGWTIIIFTIVLKLILSPLDIFQRYSSSKQQRVMAYMQPEINAVQEKYAGNQERINAETQKIYKKYNKGLGGSCVIMLVTMIVSMVIFFTLYSSIRSYGSEKLYESYYELDTTYISATVDYNTLTAEEQSELGLTEEEYALQQVQAKYEELSKSNSWLWVKNVWKADTSTSQFVDVDDYIDYYLDYYTDYYQVDAEDEDAVAEITTNLTTRYELITTTLIGDSSDNNGYYVLIVLSALVNLLSQIISTKLLTPKGQKMNMMNKIMMIVLPIFMLIFAWTSNVVFTLYIITNAIMTTLLSTIISLIMKRINRNKDINTLLKRKNVEVVEYSRNYKK